LAPVCCLGDQQVFPVGRAPPPLLVKNQKETPQPWLRGFGVKTLAMTYSRMLAAHYHRRVRVSLPSSGWDRVVPRSYCHQGEGGGSRSRWTGLFNAHTLSLVASEQAHRCGPAVGEQVGT